MSDTRLRTDLYFDLCHDEGVRRFPYTDTTGNLTIGVGRNLCTVGLLPKEIDFLLANDINSAFDELDRQITWWRQLPHNSQRVLANLCFNMGWPTLSKFVKFLDALHQNRIDDACNELKNSKWFNEVGDRGPRTIARLRE